MCLSLLGLSGKGHSFLSRNCSQHHIQTLLWENWWLTWSVVFPDFLSSCCASQIKTQKQRFVWEVTFSCEEDILYFKRQVLFRSWKSKSLPISSPQSCTKTQHSSVISLTELSKYPANHPSYT